MSGILLAGCGGGLLSFGGAKAQNTPAAYRELLFRSPNHPRAKEIRKLLDEADFKNARELHTARAYRRYLEGHPTGAHSSRAKFWAERLSYYDALSQMNSEQFKGYLKKFPKGQFATEAQERLQRVEFEEVKRKDTIASYRKFLARYKNSRSEWTAAAKQRMERQLLDVAIAKNNERALSLFVLDRPRSPYLKEAKQALKTVKFERILRSNDESAMEDFIRRHRGTEEAAVVSRRLQEVVLRTAEQTGRVDALERFLKRFPQSSQKERILASISLMERERNRQPGQWVRIKNGEVEVFRPRRCRNCKPALKVNATISSKDRDFTYDLTLQSILVEKGKRCCQMTHRVRGLRPGEARPISFTVPGKIPSGPPPALEIRILKGSAYRSERAQTPKRGSEKPPPSDRFAPQAVPPLDR